MHCVCVAKFTMQICVHWLSVHDSSGFSTQYGAADSPATLQKLMGDALPKWERMLCKAMIPVSVLLSIVGIIFSITALVQKEEEL